MSNREIDTMTHTIQPVMVTVDRSPGENYLGSTLARLDCSSIDALRDPLDELIIADSGVSERISTIAHQVLDDCWQGDLIQHRPAVCANLNVALALEYGAETGADFVLFLEDDIDVIDDFFGSVSRWLEDHITSVPVIYPLGANYGEVEESFQRGETWWGYPVSKFYGTQAFLIRSRDVESCVKYIRDHCYDLHADGTGYDHLIRDWMISNGVMYMPTPAPSFVQHIGIHSAIKRRDKIHTFPSFPGREWSYKGIASETEPAASASTPIPNICILTPMRNASKHLKLYFKQLGALIQTMPDCHFRLVVAEGDSTDGTRERVHKYAVDMNIDYTLVDTTHGMQYFRSVEDPRRLKMMSDVMNAALEQVRDSDDIVVWIMADIEYSTGVLDDMIRETIAARNEIIDDYDTANATAWPVYSILAPLTLAPDGSFWDTWGYRTKGERFSPRFNGQGCARRAQIDSAGSCLVMPACLAKTYRATDLEAVSFCNAVRENGHKIVLCSDLYVRHNYTAQLRALVVGDYGTASGYAQCVNFLLPRLSAQGYEIDVIAIDWNSQRPHNQPYNIWSAKQASSDDMLGCAQLQRMLVYNKYDVLIILGDVFCMPHYNQAIERAQTIIDTNNLDAGAAVKISWCAVDSENQIASPSLNVFDHVIVWTDFARDEICQYGCEVPVHVVPLWANPEIFTLRDDAAKRKARRELFIEPSNSILDESFYDAFVVCVIARNQPRKRIDLAIEAFATLVDNSDNKNMWLALHCLPATPAGCDINALATFYGVDDKVIKIDNLLDTQQMVSLYHAIDVLLVTSAAEGFCLPVLEAALCGVPVVAINAGAITSWANFVYRVHSTGYCVVAPTNGMPYTVGMTASPEEIAGAIRDVFKDVRSTSAESQYEIKGNRKSAEQVCERASELPKLIHQLVVHRNKV